MKKLCAAVIVFAVALVCTAVWFSPLAAIGTPCVYENNVEAERINGLCYSENAVLRVDIVGDRKELFAALGKISAEPVKTAEADGVFIVYAYSPRVASKPFKTSEGEEYNVMAACSNGTVKIGTPVLQGCY